MSYYLKVSKKNNRTYLSIYDGVYDSRTGKVVHSKYENYGELNSIIAKGIEDPMTYYRTLASNLNAARKEKNESPAQNDYTRRIRYLGYPILKWMLDDLGVQPFIDAQMLFTHAHYSLYEILSTAIFAQVTKPCSKRAAYNDVMPNFGQPLNFSYDQLLEAIAQMGSDYKKYVELFTAQLIEKYGIATDRVFFDGTNFYFEIEQEDNLRKKGPSKENRHTPLVSMGLLLDGNLLPVDMTIFPGNESEKPQLREVIHSFKSKHNITGKTIRVADKGINCARNIKDAIDNGDGYIFSRSVASLQDKEQTWVLMDDYKEVKDPEGHLLFKYKYCDEIFDYDIYENGRKVDSFSAMERRVVKYDPALAKKKKRELKELREKAERHVLTASDIKNKEYGGCGKYIVFKGKDGDYANITLNENLMKEDEKIAGYNLYVSSETHMDPLEIVDTYKLLWMIEQDFRIFKSDLEARPIYLQLEDRIKGHLLICYLSVFLIRLLGRFVFKERFSYAEIRDFVQKLNFIEFETQFINVSPNLPIRNYVATNFGVPFIEYGHLSWAKIRQYVNKKI